ncbi:MAG: hypothetical protein Q8O53_03610 [Candidatus Moranbacteria bacterium]|nr:hypothetical protein [Candidatus Moranbacteria bacterium]
MPHFWVLEALRYRKWLLMAVGISVALCAVFILFFFSSRYQVRTDFLVTQAETGTTDYYTLARSSEYIGKVLGEVMYSERFIAAVVEIGKVNYEFLPFDKKERMKEWRRMLSVSQELDLGVLHVTILSDNERQAGRVSQAVAQVLIEKNGLLLGTGEKNIPMSILSGPIGESNPSNGEIIIVGMAGFSFGVLVTLLGLFFKSEVFGDARQN